MRKRLASLLFAVFGVLGCSSPNVGPPDPPDPPDPPPGVPAWGVPISGGTMLITSDGRYAVIADPDRDVIDTVDLQSQTVAGHIKLTAGDEPGRLIEDAAGRIHVALRHGGALVTLDSATAGSVAQRRPVCGEPRGLAYDPALDVVHVACTGGELVTFPAAGGDATRNIRLQDRDLRDVIVQGNDLLVTRFRTAQVLRVDSTGVVIDRQQPPSKQRFAVDEQQGLIPAESTAETAWRTITMPDGTVLMAHQRHLQAALSTTQQGGYGNSCGGDGPVEASVSSFRPGQAPVAGHSLVFTALPVDVATDSTGSSIALAMAGEPGVRVEPASIIADEGGEDPCGGMFPPGGGTTTDGTGGGSVSEMSINEGRGAPTSVFFRPNGDLVIFYPEDNSISIWTAPLINQVAVNVKIGESNSDPGRTIFHQMTFVGLACASCHPEGRDDGQVWQFNEIGQRRTQNVSGHILDRAPYHWSGDMADLRTLMQEVFVHRMSGEEPTALQRSALAQWLDRVPAPLAPPAVDAGSAARGQALFENATVGCTTCHNGNLFTNNQLVDVGTGGVFKVPSLLGVGARAPFLHDGRAQTLADRFAADGGGDRHGHTSDLSQDDVNDLIAYLNTL